MNIPKRVYVAILISVGLWCFAIIAAPVLSTVGGDFSHAIANTLYRTFSRICHQLDSRSLHIFGAKFGVCVRCFSIYCSFLAGILTWPLIRKLDSGKMLHVGWLAIGLAPMVLDALLNDVGLHASTEGTRVVSGSIAGFTLSLYVLPLFIEAVTQLFHRYHLQGESRYAGKT